MDVPIAAQRPPLGWFGARIRPTGTSSYGSRAVTGGGTCDCLPFSSRRPSRIGSGVSCWISDGSAACPWCSVVARPAPGQACTDPAWLGRTADPSHLRRHADKTAGLATGRRLVSGALGGAGLSVVLGVTGRRLVSGFGGLLAIHGQ